MRHTLIIATYGFCPVFSGVTNTGSSCQGHRTVNTLCLDRRLKSSNPWQSNKKPPHLSKNYVKIWRPGFLWKDGLSNRHDPTNVGNSKIASFLTQYWQEYNFRSVYTISIKSSKIFPRFAKPLPRCKNTNSNPWPQCSKTQVQSHNNLKGHGFHEETKAIKQDHGTP
jgi:hypothetical protein